MSEIQSIHSEIMQFLAEENPIHVSTLPSDKERENLQIKVNKLLQTRYEKLSEQNKSRIKEEFFGSGPLASLLPQEEITEIIVNGQEHIYFEKNGRMQIHDDHFLSPISFQNFIHRLTAEARVMANLDRPFADGYWKKFRLHMIIPPLAQKGVHLCLRRHPENPWTLNRYAETNWAPTEQINFIRKLIRNHTSFLVIGGTGSGKTSVLNACMQELPQTERVVAIEDTSELRMPNHLSAKLVSRHDPQGVLRDVDQSDLLKQALRMRPDRLIMGEVRGNEAKDLLMALSTGHHGGMATLHAENARQALYRLEMLVQMGAPQWAPRAIRHLIYFGLQYIISVKKENGERKLAGIERISSLEESGFCLEKIY